MKKARSALAVAALVGAASFVGKALADEKQVSAMICRASWSYQSEIDYDSIHGYVTKTASGVRTVTCPLLTDDTDTGAGLSDLEAWVKRGSAGNLTCTAYCWDEYGTSGDTASDSTTGSNAEKLDWGTGLGSDCPTDAVYTVSCPLESGARIYGIWWVEQSDSS